MTTLRSIIASVLICLCLCFNMKTYGNTSIPFIWQILVCACGYLAIFFFGVYHGYKERGKE